MKKRSKSHVAKQDSKVRDLTAKRRQRLATKYPSLSFHSNQEMVNAISDISGWIVREPHSKKAYTVIKIMTRSKIVGYGECAEITQSEFAKAKKLAMGKPADAFEVLAPTFSDLPTIWAALNMAMLDVSGKLAKTPIFRLLGGPTRYRARVLVQLDGETDQDLIKSMKELISKGFKAFLVPIPKPQYSNQGQDYVLSVRKRLDNLRSNGGEEADFVLDGKNQLTPGDAQMITEKIEDFHVLWFNEPCRQTSIDAISKLSEENVTPIGLGNHFTEGTQVQNILAENAVDIVVPDIALTGISQIRRMAAIAETYYVALGVLNDGGPIATAAGKHLAAAIPNFFILQIPTTRANGDLEMRESLVKESMEEIKDGYTNLPLGHGLGITVNENNLKIYSESTL